MSWRWITHGALHRRHLRRRHRPLLPLPTLDPGIGNQHKLEALFYGLGSDGTVSAAKNSIKILGNHTDLYPQGYFVYDSKKAGGLTVSPPAGRRALQSAYLVDEADFIGCHQWQFIDMYQMAERLRPDGIFLLNTPTTPIRSGSGCPGGATGPAPEACAPLHHQRRQNCPRVPARQPHQYRDADGLLPAHRHHTAGRGDRAAAPDHRIELWQQGADAGGAQLAGPGCHLRTLVQVPLQALDPPATSVPRGIDQGPDFVQTVTAAMLAGLGDNLPVSAFPPDGTWPVGTTRWEKRNIAKEVPIWQADLCTQCNYCVAACPHSAIRAKVVDKESLEGAPPPWMHWM